MEPDIQVVDLLGRPLQVGNIVAVACLNCKSAVLRQAEVLKVEITTPYPNGYQRTRYDKDLRKSVPDGEPDLSWVDYRRVTVKVKTWANGTRRVTGASGDNSAGVVDGKRVFHPVALISGVLLISEGDA